ncbi:hypothetical protein BDP27DRAFT_1369850 [Rhodocollybia butyracea]|uniref:Uncharacterized protein n=1 Tax=Rhodocollybia butyracea TaxID=206335 RepID=A0A9P5U160_9AGAR|nr:hypothetical protein BDP27DRAFT_1369850 [Rhodocollybia butyracea]
MGQFRPNTSFADPVPIYDSRCLGTDLAFECEANQLHELAISSYPLYGTGMVDLPPGSVVTRHYRSIPTCVSLNIAFVVLLSLPAVPAPVYPPPTVYSFPAPSSGSLASFYPAEPVVYYEDLN